MLACQVQNSSCGAVDAEHDQHELQDVLQRSMPTPETSTEDPTAARRHQMEEEAMAFATGYVASKCRHIDSSLGWPTCDVQPSDLAAVPAGWIETISRGQLFVPSVWWMAIGRRPTV